MRTLLRDVGPHLVPVHESGPTDRSEAIVCLHGNPGPMEDFADLVPALAELGRTVALHMPGFGQATATRLADCTPHAYAAHFGATLDALRVERAHLVLHDFGGIWGLTWAARHPERVASLTLINTGVLRGYRWHFFARVWQTPVVGEVFQALTNGVAIRSVMRRDNPRPLPEAFLQRVSRRATFGQKQLVARMYRHVRDPEQLADDIEAPLRRLTCPVCVIFGAEDKYVPAELAERQRDVFPGAEVHLLEGLGHWPFIDDPQAVQQPLVAFLRRALAAAEPRVDTS